MVKVIVREKEKEKGSSERKYNELIKSKKIGYKRDDGKVR